MTTTEDTLAAVTAWVPGNPAPQGSKNAITRRRPDGKPATVLIESSKRVQPWREDIRAQLLDQPADVQSCWPYAGGITLLLEYVMPRPKSTPKSYTPAAAKKPDLDKLERAVFDAITSSGVWHDDSQGTCVYKTKRLAEVHERPGCLIRIYPGARALRVVEVGDGGR